MPALTGIRFYLAFWVVLHHISGPGMMLDGWAQTLPPAFRALLRGGYLAVGSFFVLSGFVLTRRYADTRWNARSLYRYVVSRVARIYPVYALSLAVVLPFMIMDFRPAWIANYLLVLQGWVDKPAVHWNTPAWSLSCEFFFYAFFPLLVFLFRTRTWGGVIAVASAACMLTAVLRSVGMPESWKPLLHFSDFLIGIAAAEAFDLLERAPWRPRLRGALLYLPACALFIYFVTLPPDFWRKVTLNGTLRPLNALALVGFALGGGLLARALSTPISVFLGKASYSLYILHVPVLWWWKFIQPVNPFSAGVSAVIYSVLVIAISGCIYHWFEEPGNERVRGYLLARGPR